MNFRPAALALALLLTACGKPDAFVDQRLAGHVDAFAADANRAGRANITAEVSAEIADVGTAAECRDRRLVVGLTFFETQDPIQVRAGIYRALGSCLLGRAPADNAASFMLDGIERFDPPYLRANWPALVEELFRINVD